MPDWTQPDYWWLKRGPALRAANRGFEQGLTLRQRAMENRVRFEQNQRALDLQNQALGLKLREIEHRSRVLESETAYKQKVMEDMTSGHDYLRNGTSWNPTTPEGLGYKLQVDNHKMALEAQIHSQASASGVLDQIKRIPDDVVAYGIWSDLKENNWQPTKDISARIKAATADLPPEGMEGTQYKMEKATELENKAQALEAAGNTAEANGIRSALRVLAPMPSQVNVFPPRERAVFEAEKGVIGRGIKRVEEELKDATDQLAAERKTMALFSESKEGTSKGLFNAAQQAVKDLSKKVEDLTKERDDLRNKEADIIENLRTPLIPGTRTNLPDVNEFSAPDDDPLGIK